MIAQSAMQMAPTRYFVRPAQARPSTPVMLSAGRAGRVYSALT